MTHRKQAHMQTEYTRRYKYMNIYMMRIHKERQTTNIIMNIYTNIIYIMYVYTKYDEIFYDMV